MLRTGTERDGLRIVHLLNTTSSKTKDRSSHVFDCHGSRHNEKIAPRETNAMLVLDGLEQLVGMHKIAVIWPGQLWVKALTTAIGAASSITAIQMRGNG